MNPVSVIGCGNMGSALIQALANQDVQVHIWNRTPQKAQALASSGVNVADSFGAALTASLVTIFCLSDSDYAIATELLQNEKERISGKMIIQLSSGMPQSVRKLSDYVEKNGGMYIDGGIMGHPSSIGDPNTMILLSGKHTTFKAVEPILSLLGKPQFHGEEPGVAAALDLALNIAATPTVVALLQGLKVCQVEKVQPEIYCAFIKEVFPEYLSSVLDKAMMPIDQQKTEETIGLMASFSKLLANYLKSRDIDAGMFEALARLYAGGVANGRGDHDSICVADLHSIND